MHSISFHLNDAAAVVHNGKRPSCALVLNHSSILLGVIARIASAKEFGAELSSIARGNVISMERKEFHYTKTSLPRYVTEGRMTILVSNVRILRATPSIDLTEDGTILVSDVHSSKAS